MKTIYFIRHGKTKYNEEGRFVGSTDLHLTDNGKNLISELWENKRHNIVKDMLFTSPMNRCVETANIIFPEDSFIVLTNMREMNFGLFEGKIPNELAHNKDYNEFIKTNALHKIPDGESGLEFSRRVLKAFFEMIKIMDKENVNNSALVCHGGVIMALFSIMCKESNDILHYHIDNGGGYKANYDEYNRELIIIEKL